jgi:tetratricopeptide (TPR) repeat protein
MKNKTSDMVAVNVENPILTVVRERKQLVRLVGVVMLAIVVAALLVWQYIAAQHRSKENQDFTKLQATAITLSASKQYDKAAGLWTAYAPQATTKAAASTAYVNAAALYLSNGQAAQAIIMCIKAEAVDGKTFDETSAAANAYMILGNKPEAIYYFKQEQQLLPSNATDRSMELEEINQNIKALQVAS